MRSARSGCRRAMSASTRPKPAWVDSGSPGGTLDSGRHGNARGIVPARRRLVERHRVEKRPERLGRNVEPREGIPFVALGDAHAGAEGRDLLGVGQARVVVLVPLERQPVPLDGIGDEAGGDIVLRGAVERLAHRVEVVAREVGHQPVQGLVVVLVEQLADAAGIPEVAQQPGPPGRAPLIGQGRVGRVRTVVDPLAQRLAPPPREGRLEPMAVLQGDDPPLHRLEDGVEPVEEPVGDDGVETLPVVVDDPPDVGDVVLPGLEQRLEDVALVELRVAGNRDHPSRRRVGRRQPARPQELLGQRREARHRHPHPDRSGRDVHVVPVLGAGGVRLGAAERAEPFELVAGLVAEQVLNGVKDGAAVRLHRHPVDGTEKVEVEGGHQRHHRRARRLVTADLQAVAAGPQMVRVMDHPGAEPQHFALDGGEAPGGLGLGRPGRHGRRREARRRGCPFHGADSYCVAMAARPLRRTYFWILPVAVLGSSSTNRILRGTLK